MRLERRVIMKARVLSRLVRTGIISGAILISGAAHAAFFITGTVTTLEIWRIGNVVFELSTATSTCNGQFIINASDPGLKNEYAALLAAKRSGTAVKVFSASCVSPENYSGTDYNRVDYLYPLD